MFLIQALFIFFKILIIIIMLKITKRSFTIVISLYSQSQYAFMIIRAYSNQAWPIFFYSTCNKLKVHFQLLPKIINIFQHLNLWLRFWIQPFKWIIKTRCIIHPCLLKIEQVIRYGHHGASVSNTLTLSNLWLLLSITFCQLHKYPHMQNPNMKVWCSYY